MQFFEHTDAAGDLILHAFEGEVKIAAAHGLRNPEIVAVSDHIMAAVWTFDTNQRARLDIFIQGLGLNNAMDHDQLQRLAALDPLTGIFNRRFDLGCLRVEFGRAVRAHTLLGIMIFDIDHFKVVNDTYGHLVGDSILKAVCDITRSSLREGDVHFRYGGEEFVAVLPAASVEDHRRTTAQENRVVLVKHT